MYYRVVGKWSASPFFILLCMWNSTLGLLTHSAILQKEKENPFRWTSSVGAQNTRKPLVTNMVCTLYVYYEWNHVYVMFMFFYVKDQLKRFTFFPLSPESSPDSSPKSSYEATEASSSLLLHFLRESSYGATMAFGRNSHFWFKLSTPVNQAEVSGWNRLEVFTGWEKEEKRRPTINFRKYQILILNIRLPKLSTKYLDAMILK